MQNKVTHINSYIKYLCVFAMVLTVISCDNNKVFDQYIQVENANWKIENIAVFSVEISDTSSLHNMYINIRNKGNYAYSNLYLFVKIESPDGNFSTDTVNCTLADKSGKWVGNGIGDLFDSQTPFYGNFKFAQQGKYSFSFEQAMRVENGLDGISDIGLMIEKLDSKNQ
ncbi:MAG: gliding motility lipoprotein GldH [Flavobacteriales bacterium]|nr:gliding motility lipoprotein GldH [Flavobacteriales bacterium]